MHIARQRCLRVLLSSHNPTLLDALPGEVSHVVAFCYRLEDGSSALVRLMDMENYPGLVAQGPVGHLMTQGIIDRFAKHSLGPEERKRQAHTWLAELREQVG